VQAVSATVNILLNLAVISWAGIQGVAVVYVISDIVLLVGYTWFVVRVYRTPVVIEA
jgi:O-antigen/teichoic acid export membrane protein